MSQDVRESADSPLLDLRRRGQFLIAVLLWAAAGGLFLVASSGALVTYHYAISLAERARLGLGFAPPHAGVDWFLLLVLSSGPLIGLLLVLAFMRWYRKLWLRRIALVGPDGRHRRQFSKWRPAPSQATDSTREENARYVA